MTDEHRGIERVDDQQELRADQQPISLVEEQQIRAALASAPAVHMPDEVFARISQALSVETQLRREDPERDIPRGHALPGWTQTGARASDGPLRPLGETEEDSSCGELDDCGSLD